MMSLPAQPAVERLEILDAFAELPDVRHASGKHHHLTPRRIPLSS